MVKTGELAPGPHGFSRLRHSAETYVGGGKKEVRIHKIRAGLNRAARPSGCFLVAALGKLCECRKHHPRARIGVARADPKGLENMRLGLLTATNVVLSHADPAVSSRKVLVKSARAFTLDDP